MQAKSVLRRSQKFSTPASLAFAALATLALVAGGCGDDEIANISMNVKVLKADGKPVKAQSGQLKIKWVEMTKAFGKERLTEMWSVVPASVDLDPSGQGLAVGVPGGYKTKAEGFQITSGTVQVEEGVAYLLRETFTFNYDEDTEQYTGSGTFKIQEEPAEDASAAATAQINKLNFKIQAAMLRAALHRNHRRVVAASDKGARALSKTGEKLRGAYHHVRSAIGAR